jgi:hypothetical protein
VPGASQFSVRSPSISTSSNPWSFVNQDRVLIKGGAGDQQVEITLDRASGFQCRARGAVEIDDTVIQIDDRDRATQSGYSREIGLASL